MFYRDPPLSERKKTLVGKFEAWFEEADLFEVLAAPLMFVAVVVVFALLAALAIMLIKTALS